MILLLERGDDVNNVDEHGKSSVYYLAKYDEVFFFPNIFFSQIFSLKYSLRENLIQIQFLFFLSRKTLFQLPFPFFFQD